MKVRASRRRYYDDDEDWFEDFKTITVIVEEKGPEWTGLYDQYGVKIYRVEEEIKCGFHYEPG